MSIYITQQKKEELEANVAELESIFSESNNDQYCLGILKTFKLILSEAVVVPVEESWDLSVVSMSPYKQGELKTLYPNGVIIKPKES